MKKFEQITALLVIICTLAIVAYDMVLLMFDFPDATISRVVYRGACEWPILPFVMGMVVGHILWRN